MKRKCKIIKKIPLIASLAFLVGCTTTPEPKAFNSEADIYAYVKEYMRWYIKEQMDDKDIVGLSVALVDDQKIVWSEGFGYADKEKGIKATPQTRYRAGSITKLFTDMAVMKLSEEGKMNIDKPFKTYLPAFSIKSRFGSTDNITPRNMMTHHSGLPSDWVDRMFATNPLPYTEHVHVIKDEYVATKPNTILSYSNIALTLLGHGLERVSGMKYASYVDKVLLTPLDMKHSDLHMALEGKYASKSYNDNEEVVEYPIGEVPAGALNTSVEELSHLAMMIHAKGTYQNHQVLKYTTLQKMFTVQNKNVAFDTVQIGLGYFKDEKVLGKAEPIYGHNGATIAHRADFVVAPKSKLGVVVLANSAAANVHKISTELIKKAWEAKTGKKVPKIKAKKIEHDSDFVGTYATILGKVDIEKKSKNSYSVHTNEGDFIFIKDKDNLYTANYKLWGLFDFTPSEMKEYKFYTKDVDGKHLLMAVGKGYPVVGGVRVSHYTYT